LARKLYSDRVKKALGRNPVVALLGPRQCGKTTLARQMIPAGHPQYFNLEDPVVAQVMENPMTALQGLKGLVVIDEAQRQPGLFPVLRVLADRAEQPATFLILGSASPEFSRQAAESLAGRVEIIEMRGFDLNELPAGSQEALWQRGGFPRSYLAASLGTAPNTARAYLDALEQTYMIRRLLPWQANLGKRLVKTPKIYFRDSGLFHTLTGIPSATELLTHPKLGASWEGFALEEIIQAQQPDQIWFYAVHSGSELDLLMEVHGKRVGVEFKRADAPTATRAMHLAITDLGLDELWVVYPGTRVYALDDRIKVRPLADCIHPDQGGK
jgi:predicted AAA+ superfamily ATPase